MMMDDAGRGAELIVAWFDRSPIGRMVVSRDARVTYSNGAARALLGRGGPLQVRDGALRANNAKTHEQLHAALTAKSRRYLAMSAASNGGPLMAMIEPMDGAHAIVSMWRAARPPLAMLAPVAGFYGLSQQQARVAAELIAGRTVEEIARKLSISIDTVRSHLKGIYEKTGARSQTEVLAFALRCFVV